MKVSHVLGGLAVTTVVVVASQPASAQFFGDGPNIFCTTLSIACPPPPPAPMPIVEAPPPVKKVQRVRKVKKVVAGKVAPKPDAAQ